MSIDYLAKFRVDGKVAAVTGASGGIGLACAMALAQGGARVAVLERDEATAARGVASLAAEGIEARGYGCDVVDPALIETTAEAIETGLGPVDILVCCAGMVISNVPAEQATPVQWRQVIDVNLNGLFFTCQAFGRRMLARGHGSIVNIGSISGFIVNKPQEQASYNASKAGVHHLTKSLAAEWASRGVRVNAVAPTYIDTPLTQFGMQDAKLKSAWLENTPMGRVGRTDEIAAVALFLASEASSLMTGSIVLADGGYTSW